MNVGVPKSISAKMQLRSDNSDDDKDDKDKRGRHAKKCAGEGGMDGQGSDTDSLALCEWSMQWLYASVHAQRPGRGVAPLAHC